MSSTDQNLNHPNQVIEIQLQRMMESLKTMEVVTVTQDLYDRMAVPDPHTCYVISDARDGRMYLGTSLIIPSKMGPRYFMTIENDEWVVYHNDRAYDSGRDHMVEICRYTKLEDAASIVAMYNRAGSHATTNLQIYKNLINYINEEAGIDNTILAVLVVMGYKESPEFQTLVQFLVGMNRNTTYSTPGKNEWQQNIKPECAEELLRRSKMYPASMYAIYNKIYEVFVKYNFFKSKTFKDDPTMANLTNPIDDIVEAVTMWRFPPNSIH